MGAEHVGTPVAPGVMGRTVDQMTEHLVPSLDLRRIKSAGKVDKKAGGKHTGLKVASSTLCRVE